MDVLTNVSAAQHALHLTRAFGAPLYRGFLESSVSLFKALVVQTRRGQVSSAVRPDWWNCYGRPSGGRFPG